jgi:hypothetical protein
MHPEETITELAARRGREKSAAALMARMNMGEPVAVVGLPSDTLDECVVPPPSP